MSGFLKSPLVAMSQLGGCDEGGSDSVPFVFRAKTANATVGEVGWTPPPEIQSVLHAMMPEAREAVMQSAAHLQEILATALATGVTHQGWDKMKTSYAVINRLLDKMRSDLPSD